MSLFEIRDSEIAVSEVVAAVSRAEASENNGLAVSLLEYQAYASMASKEMARIAQEIALEIPNCRLAALHRTGSLKVGDVAVVCAASTPHRAEAFDACRLLIDRIKARVPVWKREHGPNGPYWVGWEDARCEPGSDHAHHAHPHPHHEP